jgi:hypothetical protein
MKARYRRTKLTIAAAFAAGLVATVGVMAATGEHALSTSPQALDIGATVAPATQASGSANPTPVRVARKSRAS